MMDPNEATKELASLRRQLAEERDNLRLIHERKSKCVLETEIPLTLIKEERRCEAKIAELEKEIAELEKQVAEPAEPLPQSPPDVPAPLPPSEPDTRIPETLLIPAGSFWMGSARDDPEAHDNEKPRRELHLPNYWIARYPVTNAQYTHFLADNPHHPVPYLDEERSAPYNWDSQTRKYPSGKGDHPVVLVSWEDAAAYCRWLSRVTGGYYRLPTEEEWEKAARGGRPEMRRYPWGDEWRSGVCNTREPGRNGTTSVREFEEVNRSPFGIVDMAGNVWEWTDSWYGPYPGSSYERSHFGVPRRVVRGGSWINSSWDARISCRGRYEPDVRRPYLGFRIASDVGAAVSGARAPGDGSGEEMPDQVNRVRLRRLIADHFDIEELRTLCFDLGVDYDDLRGEGKTGKVRELVAHFERRGLVHELIEACKRERPNVRW